jgi:hypothetical protein
MDTAQLTLVRQPFDHPDFLFELKHDGFRALAGNKLLARVLVPLLNIPENCILIDERAQGDDFRTFLAEFVSRRSTVDARSTPSSGKPPTLD